MGTVVTGALAGGGHGYLHCVNKTYINPAGKYTMIGLYKVWNTLIY